MSDVRKRRRRRRRRGREKSHWLLNTILVISIIVFGVSAFQLFKIGKGYLDGRSEYDKIRDIAVTTKDSEDEEEKDAFQVDFEKLLEINPDTIGWIRFDPEPDVISYPIVQGKDNYEYLHKTFSANENTLGAIFLSVDNDKSFGDRNSIIYGHRMKDGSMFRHLQDYEKKEFWEKNPYFYIYTLDGRTLKYHIYSAGVVKYTSDTYLTQFSTDEEYENFLQMTKQVSNYDTGVEVGIQDKIVTLSTCTSASDDHRFVVRGVLEEGEN